MSKRSISLGGVVALLSVGIAMKLFHVPASNLVLVAGIILGNVVYWTKRSKNTQPV